MTATGYIALGLRQTSIIAAIGVIGGTIVHAFGRTIELVAALIVVQILHGSPVVALVIGPITLLRLLGLLELRLLRRRDDSVVVLGMLQKIFRRNHVARNLRITRQRRILFRDMGRRTTDLHIRPVRLVTAGERIWPFAVAAARTPVLGMPHETFSIVVGKITSSDLLRVEGNKISVFPTVLQPSLAAKGSTKSQAKHLIEPKSAATITGPGDPTGRLPVGFMPRFATGS